MSSISFIPVDAVSDDILDNLDLFRMEHLHVVRAIAYLDLSVSRDSGRWPNPALATLVWAVAPIWARVTERTIGLTFGYSITNEKKQSLFANWLVQILQRANLHPASEGQVIGIVRDGLDQKKEKSMPLIQDID